MTADTIEIVPLAPVIGAEVRGVDLSKPMTPAAFETLRNAWLNHVVLFFRDQVIGVDELKQFGARFGKLHIHPQGDMPGYPGVLKIHTDKNSETYAGHRWHSDVSCDAAPPAASILHLDVVPDSGGDTLFANMYAAYEALSAPMRAFLDGLHAFHCGKRSYGDYFGQRPEEMRDGKYPEAVHPVVRTHPESARKCLFVNENFTDYIVELSSSESNALLELLYRHVTEPRFQCRFRWTPNAIAMWDNRCSQHMAMWDYYPQTRSGYRVTIVGEQPY